MIELILSVPPQQVVVPSEPIPVEQVNAEQTNAPPATPGIVAPEVTPPQVKVHAAVKPEESTPPPVKVNPAPPPPSQTTGEKTASEAAKAERHKLLEQKLAEIVARDKLLREERMRQNPQPEKVQQTSQGNDLEDTSDLLDINLSDQEHSDLLKKIRLLKPGKKLSPSRVATKKNLTPAPVDPGLTVKLGPVTANLAPITPPILGSIRLWQGKLKVGNGDLQLIFPLPFAVPFTSGFGWRIHPVSGESRFHQGVDLGAALGTPVVATLSGKVVLADWVGGYGMTVVIAHNNGTQETLYGHLSEILVRPGDQVEQGTIIGRVGSTGLSTGPHLHFELRQLTADGWVPTDPGALLQLALAQLTSGFTLSQLTEKATDMSDDYAAIPPPPTMKRAIVHNF
jgi:murein DD-endopeptidase MepM/ murein hydrolase activator NlpD